MKGLGYDSVLFELFVIYFGLINAGKEQRPEAAA
jgi:hypothetical protein